MVLRRRQRDKIRTVRHRKDRGLRPRHEFLHKHRAPCAPEERRIAYLLERPNGVIARTADDDPFARGETVRLDDKGERRRADMRERLVHTAGGERRRGRGRDGVASHEILGKRFAPLKLGGALRRPEYGEPGVPELIDDAGGKGCFGPDDGQIDPEPARRRDETGKIPRIRRKREREFGGPRIPGSAVELLHPRALRQLPDERMFTAA